MSPDVPLPPATPSTVQVAAPPPGTVAVNCCVRDTVIAAVFGDRLMVTLETVTAAVTVALVPPAPLQVSEYDEFAVMAPVLRVPLLGNAPLQAPEAVHAVALVELHISVEAPPAATIAGFTVRVAVGAAATVTVAVTVLLVPPAPLQVSEYDVFDVMAPVLRVPLVANTPLQPPDALQEVAFVELQLNVDSWPPLTVVCDALIDAVGTGLIGGAPPPLPPLSPHDAKGSAATIAMTLAHFRITSLRISPCVIDCAYAGSGSGTRQIRIAMILSSA